MRDVLDNLAARVTAEIKGNGVIVVGGQTRTGSAPHSANPFKGMCADAVEKLQELAPELNIGILSLKLAADNAFARGFHVVAEVDSPEGTYIVDPTIGQYLPSSLLVYGPDEKYPLKVVSIVRR